jgi:benzoyl-CoA reductase/2-hydroxyglutaryl-CoA dehydratase subunit BcrC/BadD/HgdB
MSPNIWTLTDLPSPITNPVPAWITDKFDDLEKLATSCATKPAQVRCASINRDLTDRLTMFRQPVKEIHIDGAVFLNEFRRAAESPRLPQLPTT